MNKNVKKILRAIVINLIVALFSAISIIILINLFFGKGINRTFSLLNKFEIDTSKKNKVETTIDSNNTIKNYPEYGTKYATIEIPKIGVNLPVYFGDTLEILRNGIGHSSGSYFPGEGGSIIYMGHNSEDMLRNLGDAKIDDKIVVKTSYGEYIYKIYNTEIVNEKEYEKLPVQSNKEILMLYTCYPFKNIGYTTNRYVVYAELVKL